MASESRRRSPPDSPSSGFSAASPLNRNRPEQRARLVGLEAGGALGRLQHRARARRPELLGVLGEQPELDVVAAPQLAGVELALPGQRLDQRRLAGPVGADQRHVLAALEPQLEVVEQRALADPQRPVLDLEHHASRPLGRLEGEAERLAVAGVARDPVDLLQLLHARLRLARPSAGPEAVDEPLEPRDLGLLLLDRPPERQLARRLLLAPGVPGALEEAAAAGLELEHRGAHRLQEPAVVRHQHDGGVERLQMRFQPLERLDVEVVGGLVEQQQVGIAGQRAGQRRARELAAAEGLQAAVHVRVAEAEPVQRAVDALAPGVAARVLEPRLGARVRVERGGVVRALGHRVLELGQARLEVEQVLGAGEHVVAQAEVAVARRPLVVQREPDVLGEAELAAVHRRLAGEHPQQRRLARAVAAGQRHPVPALEPEGDAAQERLARHVLGEIGGDDDCHGGSRVSSGSCCGPSC